MLCQESENKKSIEDVINQRKGKPLPPFLFSSLSGRPKLGDGESQRSTVDIVLDARDADVIVKYPIKETEFEVQAELYRRLANYCEALDNGFEVKSEVTVYIDSNVRMRFDLMIFHHRKPVCGIEVKKVHGDKSSDHFKSQQTKYKMFTRVTGIPVYYCHGLKQIESTVGKVKVCL